VTRLRFTFIFIFCSLRVLLSQTDTLEERMDAKIAGLKNDSAKIKELLKFSRYERPEKRLMVKYATMAVALAEKNRYGSLTVEAYELSGNAYWAAKNYGKALEYYFKSLKAADSLNLKYKKAIAYYNIGWIKCIQQESFQERNYLISSQKIFESLNDTGGILLIYHALAGTYQVKARKDPAAVDSALHYFRNLIYFWGKYRNEYNVAMHSNYANFLIEIGRYKEAKMYLYKCIEVSKKDKDVANYATSKFHMGEILIRTDSAEKALSVFEEIIPLLRSTDQIETLSELYEYRSKIYAGQKKYKEAYEDHVMFEDLADSTIRAVFKSNLAEQETAFEIEKRENNIKKLEHLNEMSELKNRQNRYVIFGLLFIALLVAIITLNLFRNNQAKQKANRLLNEKNQLIEEQKKAVEERNLDITNSINYAKRIQDAILPQKEIKYRLFPDAFVLFQPKDIVSGDFYWFAERKGRRLIAAIDCTGHGVPGAFMSLIGNTFLHEAVNEKGITDPALILNELRNNVIASLKQTDVIDSTKDGMDMALLSFNDADLSVDFAGANNPLWLIRNGECTEYKGDKRPIGYYMGKGLPFTANKIELKKGDSLYIFSDGYADQFGGPGAKKFKYRQLRELLISVQHLSMKEQEAFLLKKFKDWKGGLEQVDDVCVIGIRI
jgi:serine phosphatase RsbU (regulator of sigma subunit)